MPTPEKTTKPEAPRAARSLAVGPMNKAPEAGTADEVKALKERNKAITEGADDATA